MDIQKRCEYIISLFDREPPRATRLNDRVKLLSYARLVKEFEIQSNAYLSIRQKREQSQRTRTPEEQIPQLPVLALYPTTSPTPVASPPSPETSRRSPERPSWSPVNHSDDEGVTSPEVIGTDLVRMGWCRTYTLPRGWSPSASNIGATPLEVTRLLAEPLSDASMPGEHHTVLVRRHRTPSTSSAGVCPGAPVRQLGKHSGQDDRRELLA